ncbi:MAG: tetratricopeptide repeat protein [Myxococcales bacterium]|nr:MAG: tetratricopeptide repeat protein [Myxococcales bacterium]
MRWWRAASAASVALALLAPVSVSRAQERDPPAAEALFERGRAALEAGQLAEACALFAESYRLDAAVGTLLNQARCEEQRGQLAEAWEHFRTAAEQLPPGDERLAMARGRAVSLDARVPRLTLRLTPPVPDRTRVLRDRVELREASLGVALPLNPGAHSIEVQAPGHEPRVWSLDVREGERRELSLAPGARLAVPSATPPPAAVASTAPRPAGRSTRSTVGWAAGSVGAAALLASIGLGAWAYERQRYVSAHCPGGVCEDARGLQASGELRSLTRVSTGAFVTGLLGLGAGTYLVLTGDF